MLDAYIGLYLLSLEKILKKLFGKNDIEDALKRLDTLTMEEARMAIAETLKVANRVDNKVDKVDDKVDKVDDKVMVLIDGEQIVFLSLLYFSDMDMTRRERRKRAVCEHRRGREAFVLSSHCHWLPGLIYSHREPVTREIAKVALSSGSFDKS